MSGFVRLVAVVAVVGLGTTDVGAQAAGPPRASLEAMEALHELVGDWSGDGWMALPTGERVTFLGTEQVRPELRGLLLVVRGQFAAADDPDGPPVHEALGIVSYDAGQRAYAFRAYTLDGRSGTFPLEPTEGGFVWSMDMPQGRIRYTVRLSESTWHEVGEITFDDGATWRPFLEMTLQRQE